MITTRDNYYYYHCHQHHHHSSSSNSSSNNSDSKNSKNSKKHYYYSVTVTACLVLLLLLQSTTTTTAATTSAATTRSFTIANDRFVRDGVNVTLRGGAIHYSRVPPELWLDRLTRLRAMGLNAVQTYVPWNWHAYAGPDADADFGSSSSKGRLGRNLTEFLQLAQSLDLVVVLRAGPYMCGEWEFGGLPAWLLNNGTIKLRTMAEPYFSSVKKWWTQQLLPVVKPMLYENGGPVVMVQVENEYGSYGDVSKNPSDAAYMRALVALARGALGDNVVLFTTDGGNTGYMTRGSLKGSSVYTVGDGCGSPAGCDAAQRTFNAPGQSPFMCSECYTGWLTHWGEGGANTSSSAPHTASILDYNNGEGSISLYMGHGGTNFGWWSGANGGGGSSYSPHETSYDYDSPVSEAGEHGYHGSVDKYAAMRTVMVARANKTTNEPPVPPEPPLLSRTAYGAVPLTQSANLLDEKVLAALAPTPADTNALSPPPAETVGCYYGFILYTTVAVAGDGGGGGIGGSLTLGTVRDRAQVFVDGVYVGVSYRTSSAGATLSVPSGWRRLQLLVENMGRINFSHGMDDARKGILGNVTVGSSSSSSSGSSSSSSSSGSTTLITNWTTHCLPLEAEDLARVPWTSSSSSSHHQQPAAAAASSSHSPSSSSSSTAAFAVTGPTLMRGTLSITGGGGSSSSPADTFFLSSGWSKGAVFVNGFNLGRFWETEGPQHTLYVPAPRLRTGNNDIVVLELHNGTNATATFVGQPVLQTPSKPQGSCSPVLPAGPGSKVLMFTQAAKLAHQQAWDIVNISTTTTATRSSSSRDTTNTFQLALRADPTLCVSVETGCPHAAQGCLSIAPCQSAPPATLFTSRPDPHIQGKIQVLTATNNDCLDIYSHSVAQGAPVEVWACYGPGEDNQRWTYDADTGLLASAQAGNMPGPFVLTTCTQKNIVVVTSK